MSAVYNRLPMCQLEQHTPGELRAQVVHLKGRLECSSFPGVIYKITYNDCDAASTGESGDPKRHMRQLENKVAEGQSASNALSKHGKNTGHRIYWDSASVIAVETRLSTITKTIALLSHKLQAFVADAFQLDSHVSYLIQKKVELLRLNKQIFDANDDDVYKE
ncbi:hypothetical protein HPB49_003455 [Dermacentor silvarum]|uniref:Uncharacterized protein n=1 Tax=Dermacentor silvarum TaxID=543639 RepID=A0ACB8CUT6_DERSI|nr:hypothetical protein HPB49_003455 [Dermacentor silvarum]